MRHRLIPVIVILLALAGGAWWWFSQGTLASTEIVLHGNVEMRDVSLAFNDAGRIDRILVEEGAKVKKGDVIATLDTSRLMPLLAQAEAQVAAQTAALNKLKAGSRPEEVAQVKATAAAAHADATNAALGYERARMLSSGGASSSVTASQLDTAKAVSDAASAKANAADQAVAIVVAGARAEDVAQAQATLNAGQAGRDLIRQQLADATLKAPVDGVIRSRLLEPGEIASSARPVVSIAIVDPKWVRAYLSETDLARVKAGQSASVSVDGVAKPLTGTVGFISPVAEFTPRAIQTQELRTSLVYEVRILVNDIGDVLKLGMPATVHVNPNEAPATAPAPTP